MTARLPFPTAQTLCVGSLAMKADARQRNQQRSPADQHRQHFRRKPWAFHRSADRQQSRCYQHGFSGALGHQPKEKRR